MIYAAWSEAENNAEYNKLYTRQENHKSSALLVVFNGRRVRKDIATDPHREEAERNFKLAQKRCKQQRNRHIRFAPTFRVGNCIFLDRPPLFL